MSAGVRRLVVVVLVFAACSQHVTAERWQQMTAPDKTLYVRSLIGGEKAKSAKGGSARRYTAHADEYVRQIDDAYARGDRRDPSTVFADLADRR